MFANKTLLITGGTGSFGNAVLRRFLDSDLSEIRIFSRDEKDFIFLELALEKIFFSSRRKIFLFFGARAPKNRFIFVPTKKILFLEFALENKSF